MASRVKVCTDRHLPQRMREYHPTIPVRGGRGRTRAIAPIGKTWMNGTALRVRFIGGTAAERETTREQAGWWTEVANLKLDFGNASNAEIRISFDPNDGAWSYIGTDCRGIPVNEATMNLGFLDGGTAAHEFGHAIGLAHEHQSPDGGMRWNEQVVIQEMAKSPNFWDEATTRHNILSKYEADQVNGTAFDRLSIMLYFFPASWTLNGVGTEANEVISPTDKQFIASAKMYPMSGAVANAAVELEVNASRRTDAGIGKVGEEDLFRFTAPSDGRYIIDTRGPTDVVLKLFGPNSQTALIAEDDDSGLETNARITANLVKGDYFVQVRHYNRASGVGKYTVKVSKA